MSMLVNLILGLVVPKFIDEYQYAYWQSYVLYVGYVGILHLGMLDGILLRYSQYNYEELNKPILCSQFKFMHIFNILCAIAVAVGSMELLHGECRKVGVLVGIGIITKNVFTYSYYLLQSTNRIDKYSIFIITHRIVYSVVVVFLLLLKNEDFAWFCIADLLGDVVATCAIGFRYNKGLYYGKTVCISEAMMEFRDNITAGAPLLIANCSSQLLIGSAKMIVQWRWNELIFSKVSFSFSLANLFLVFIQAISVVLFPALKRSDENQLPVLYKNVRDSITPLLFVILICYYPGYWILKKWLPAYETSLEYLGILLPIIIFTSKVGLLTNNYLKAYRKEKELFYLNVTSVFVAFILFGASAYLFNSLMSVLICAVLVIMFRSVISEIYVMKLINIKFYKEFVLEGVITIVFIATTRLSSLMLGFFVYFAVLLVYFIIYRRSIAEAASKFKNIIRK